MALVEIVHLFSFLSVFSGIRKKVLKNLKKKKKKINRKYWAISTVTV